MNINVTNIESIDAWVTDLKEFQLDSIFETRILGKAYEYIKAVVIEKQEDHYLTASIKGSDLYNITLKLEDKTIKGSCTCPYNGNCKHMAALILNMKKIKF